MCSGSFYKQNNSLEKKIPATTNAGIQWCHPNYTKKRNVRDLLDTPDPKDELSTVQSQSLRPLRTRAQLINTKKAEWYGAMRAGPYTKTKKL